MQEHPRGASWLNSRSISPMSYFFKVVSRFLRVMVKYPRAGISFLLRVFDIVPGSRRFVQYRKDRVEEKLRLKGNKQNIGHALGDRHIVCTLFGWEIIRFKLAEGAEATADQFFLNRPVWDVKHLLKLAGPYVRIAPGDSVFDPGCGAGRHLLYLADTLSCDAIGVDVYEPAIEVAEVANYDHKVRFMAKSSIAPGFLDRVIPDGCDVVFINSWLNHVKDFDGYSEFAAAIMPKCRFLLVITSAKDDLQDLFEQPEILVHDEREGTRFVVIRGERG